MLIATGMNVSRRQLAEDEPRRIGEELRDESGLLFGRERAQRVHEVLREARDRPATPVRIHSFATAAIVSGVRTSVSPVGRPVAAFALVA